MPNQDGTGPKGKGSKTGRGKGNCGSKKTSSNPESTVKENGTKKD